MRVLPILAPPSVERNWYVQSALATPTAASPNTPTANPENPAQLEEPVHCPPLVPDKRYSTTDEACATSEPEAQYPREVEELLFGPTNCSASVMLPSLLSCTSKFCSVAADEACWEITDGKLN